MKYRLIRQLALLLICGISALSATAKTTIKVAAAGNLRYALSEIEAAYEANHKDVDLQINYGASGTFYQQIVSGAPYDLFLSADDILPQKLKEAGITSSESYIYACGKLALYGLRDDIDKLGFEVLKDSSINRISVANPRVAPYGAISVRILKTLDLWSKLEPKIIYGDTIAQAAQFAMSGNCDIGFTALSLLLNPEIELKGSYYIIPEELCAPNAQVGIILKEGEAVSKLFEYILSSECDAVWAKYGYSSAK